METLMNPWGEVKDPESPNDHGKPLGKRGRHCFILQDTGFWRVLFFFTAAELFLTKNI
jgi:hypothetical protein